ncbi:GNAT family N-acetyltransferase [Actinoplanes sp. NPDC051513]|uniref:GNAT family N-acetyltransferase n=1 Tax=Actinoplanes sp. NPDC051513 TaxID=3363908 RepID=UPI0037A2ED02
MTFQINHPLSADASFVAEVTDLVNEVYAVAEKGMWLDGTDRATPGEIAGLIAVGRLVVARDPGGELVGAMQLQRLPTGEGELGMLVAHPQRRGAGIGKDLISYGESWARTQGLTTMQLELLYPSTWTHPVKKFLYDWYTRLGYQVIGAGDLADDYPELVSRLATPCDFLIFHKAL